MNVVLQFFPEPLDNAGNPVARARLKPDAVIFTVKALQATRTSLNGFIGVLPPSVVARASDDGTLS